MKLIPLFFIDFRKFVRSEKFTDAGNPELSLHPVLYYEEEGSITFYKPIGSVIYFSTLSKVEPINEEMDLKNIKMEFNAVELPQPISEHYIIRANAQ